MKTEAVSLWDGIVLDFRGLVPHKELAGMIDHSRPHPTMTDQELDDGWRLAVRSLAAHFTSNVWVKRISRDDDAAQTV